MLLLLLFTGCKSHEIDSDTAVKVYVENLIAEEKYSSKPDSLNIERQTIFKKYNVSQADFDNYLQSMNDDTGKWEEFFKNADTYLNELKASGIVN